MAALLEEAEAQMAQITLNDMPQVPPPPLNDSPPLNNALQAPPTTPALGRLRSESAGSAISELTATPATQAPMSTARRTPGRRSTASPAFSPAFSTMSVRGELRVPQRRSLMSTSTSSLRSVSHPWTAAAAAAARRGQEEAFRRESNEANVMDQPAPLVPQAFQHLPAAQPTTICADSPPQRRSLLMDTLTRQLRREQRDSGATRSVGREAPPAFGDSIGSVQTTPARSARRRAAPPSDVTNTGARAAAPKAGAKAAPPLARRGRKKDQPSMLAFR